MMTGIDFFGRPAFQFSITFVADGIDIRVADLYAFFDAHAPTSSKECCILRLPPNPILPYFTIYPGACQAILICVKRRQVGHAKLGRTLDSGEVG
ncbi:MAG: hypothetical protein IH605_16465 [Burkholderiales bacterium]|nr:hypothetical protein [Burkholderiales bacterium]